MKKILVIEFCQHCNHCSNDIYGTRYYHPKVVKKSPEGNVPKDVHTEVDKDNLWLNTIPKWCPLEDKK